MKSLLLFALVLTSTSVFANSGGSADSIKRSMAKNMAAMVELNQNLSCRNDRDCDVIAVGARACGGPSGFIIVSSLNPKLEQLSERARLSSQLEREYNARAGVISICSIKRAPEVGCVRNACRELK